MTRQPQVQEPRRSPAGDDARTRPLAELPVRERRLELAGVSTAVLEAGEGPPVVLLHGPGANAAHWMRVIPDLARTHSVVAPDLPGQGSSEVSGESLDVERVVAWLGELIERTCPASPALVGHALGGAIAARFASDHGDRLSHLLLVDAFGLVPFAPAPELARIAVPTTLIWGRHDVATPLRVAEDASTRYGWNLRVIDDCADDPPIERPEAFLRALRTAVVDPGALTAAGFSGEIVDREHPRYDELRKVFNGMVDRRPALIARCTDARDVSAAVNFARDRGLPVSVYGGGHNVTGRAVCDDGVTIDLRPMKGIDVNPENRTCRAEAGLTWGELDAATQQHGLAVTGGRMSTTGLGGLVLGGGSGWIERKCGYGVDNLLSVETVTADGQVLTASESENAELFWGTRGGGGNFGVVTSFEFRLHPIGPTVLGGMLIYPAPMAAAVLRNFRDVMADAADEVGAGVTLLTAPPEDFVPEPVRGQPVVGMIVCYAGPVEEGEKALRPLREFGPPAVDMVEPMPYLALQQLIDSGYPAGMRNHWTGDFLSGLPDEAIEVLCRFHLSRPSPLTQILTLPGGGASARVPDGTSAIGQRQAPFNIHITSLWPDPADDDANIAWTRELSAALKPFTTGRVYVNFIGDEGQERVVAAFGTEGYARLQALKDRYDPNNLFRSNQNIKPSGASGRRSSAGLPWPSRDGSELGNRVALHS